MPKPTPGTYPTYFKGYIDQVQENEFLPALESQAAAFMDIFGAITEQKSNRAYAPGKWTIKEMLQHMIDTERIFAYRALCLARSEKQNLPGFDENDYANNAHTAERSWQSLLEEFKQVRESTIGLFKSFSPSVMNNSGLTNNNPTTVISMGFITAGHYAHHIKILAERYLAAAV